MKNKPFIPASPPLLLLFFLTLHFTVAAQSNLSKNNVAVSGFDVVSYHKNKAIEGNVNHKVNHKGAVYLFDNEVHKSTFEANPEKFIPQDDCPIILNKGDANAERGDEVVKSFYFRELNYCLDHCIHHQSLIKIGLIDQNLDHLIDENFGVAFSTQNYRNKCAS